MNQRRVVTNGITLNVAEAGPADAPLIVLLHGFPEFSFAWRRQIDFLVERGFRVWAPDQRGYNLSDKPRAIDAYRIGVLVEDVVGLLDAAGAEKVGIVGHDWGGVVAWELARRHPDRLSGVAILNAPTGAALLGRVRGSLGQLRRSWYIAFFQLPWLPEFFSRLGDWRLVTRALVGGSRAGTFSAGDLEAYRRAWSEPGAYRSMLNWYRAAARGVVSGDDGVRRSAKDRISVRTLVIWGTNDRFLETELAAESVAGCDDARIEYLEGASHWVHLEEADRVNELLGEFFGEQRTEACVDTH